LLAVSPLAATLSAPTTMASTLPCAIRAAAAESQMRVAGKPSCISSYAVKRAPVQGNVGLLDAGGFLQKLVLSAFVQRELVMSPGEKQVSFCALQRCC